MKRNARIIPWIVALVILPTSTWALGKKKPAEITQTHFSAEGNSVQRPVAMPAHDREVTLKSWQGYREIELSGETAVEFKRIRYRWDGNTYNKVKSESHEIR